MRTKRIQLFYSITPDEIIPPAKNALERKDQWLREIQRTIESKWNPRIIRVTYEIFNPDVGRIMKFFNGPVVKYWTIQNFEMLDTLPGPDLIKRARETMLDEVLGYDVELIDRKVRRRKSTADLLSTQKWTDLLETIKETLFDPNGYEMPDSEQFWSNAKEYGHEQAERIALETLQNRLKKRLSTDMTNGHEERE